MIQTPHSVWRAYDIRGVKETEIDATFARNLGRALAAKFRSRRVVIGYDARPSSIEYADYLIEGLSEQGVEVLNIGMVPTELVPITAGLHHISEAIIVTASHNPPEFVGFKLLTDTGRAAITDELGRKDIRAMVESPGSIPQAVTKGSAVEHDPWPDYCDHLFKLVPKSALTQPLSLLAEAGNGMGGAMVEHLLADLPITITPLLFEPDGTYPVHTPNPMLPAARKMAEREAKQALYDLTVMFDGDADRAAFLDETGAFIPADYFDTLIMDNIIHPTYPDSPVIIDYRRGWSTDLAAREKGYTVFRSKAGYPNIKRAMQEHQAAFGFEASAHTMYDATFLSESSGLTLLYILKILNDRQQSTSQIIKPYKARVVMIDETNYHHANPESLTNLLQETYKADKISQPDGLVIEASDWHMSLRASNTEPLIRLNLEALSPERLEAKYSELEGLIKQSGGRSEAH